MNCKAIAEDTIDLHTHLHRERERREMERDKQTDSRIEKDRTSIKSHEVIHLLPSRTDNKKSPESKARPGQKAMQQTSNTRVQRQPSLRKRMLNTPIIAVTNNAGWSTHGVNTFNTILILSLLQEPHTVMATEQESRSQY